MSSCGEGHVCHPPCCICTLNYLLYAWNVMCPLGNSCLSRLGQRKGGGPRLLSHPVSLSVCYSGSAISLECSASCQREVTAMVCTHNTAETQGWLKKAWKWGDSASVNVCLPVANVSVSAAHMSPLFSTFMHKYSTYHWQLSNTGVCMLCGKPPAITIPWA